MAKAKNNPPAMREPPTADAFYRILVMANSGASFYNFKRSFLKRFGKEAGLSVISKGEHLKQYCEEIYAIAKERGADVRILIIREQAYAGAYRYAPPRHEGEDGIIF